MVPAQSLDAVGGWVFTQRVEHTFEHSGRRSQLEVGDDGKVQGVAEALKKLVSEREWLKGNPAPASAGSPTNPTRPGGGLTLEQIRNMTPEQINANWDAVQLTLARK